MTVRDYLYLSWLSYIDLPALYVSVLKKGGAIPVAAFADCILRMDAEDLLPCISLNDAARSAAETMKNSECIITGYINNNLSDGFVAYVIKCGLETVIAMRGSESRGDCGGDNIDWVDNFCEPFYGSVQLSSIRTLLSSLPQNIPITFTGHSKGGHNALLAASLSAAPYIRAIAFNGQGFSGDALSDEEKLRLERHAVNYVVAADVVGALLYHPERRIFVKQMPDTNAHMPEAFTFDEKGAPVKARRAPISLAAGAATRAADGALGKKMRRRAADICRLALRM